jgi:hypothetical protein
VVESLSSIVCKALGLTPIGVFFKKRKADMVTHTCNASYLGSRDRKEDHKFKASLSKVSSETLSQDQSINKRSCGEG